MLPASPLSQNLMDFAVSGDVTLAPSAVIAPGVLLQAEPDSQIVIGAGVCIGIGAILHAHEGLLEIRVGTTIGAGVLIVGAGEIGSNACIGSGSTLINPAIKAEMLIASGSLIGDTSRKLEDNHSTEADSSDSTPTPETVTEPENASPSPSPDSDHQPEEAGFPQPKVYGQANLDQLLNRLLPHRKPLNNSRPKPG